MEEYLTDPKNAISLFQTFEKKTARSLFKFMISLRNFTRYFYSLEVYKIYICVFITLCHLIMFFPKSMRKSCTNIILIAISINDILLMLFRYATIVADDPENYEFSCNKSMSSLFIYSQMAGYCFIQLLIRTAIWLALMMAFLRTISIKNSTYIISDILSSPKCGLITTFLIYATSFIIALLAWFGHDVITEDIDWTGERDKAKPTEEVYVDYYGHEYRSDDYDYSFKPPPWDPSCQLNNSFSYTWDENQYFDYYEKTHIFGTKGLPYIVIPILTFLMVRTSRRMKRLRKTKSESLSREFDTTSIAVYCSACFMISEFPHTVAAIFEDYYEYSYGMIDISYSLSSLYSNTEYIIYITRPLFCYLLLARYRESVRKILCCGSKKFAREQKRVSGSSSSSVSFGTMSLNKTSND